MKLKYKLIQLFNVHFTERFMFFRKAMNFISKNNIGGDYLEFGVYKGVTFSAAYHFSKLYKLKMKFYAFDSFKGLPKVNDQHFKTGQYCTSEENFKKIIRKNGVDLSRVKIVRGWYKNVLNEETKKKLNIKKASFIYIDCDLYESAKQALDFATNYIQNGTIIGFDDWNLYNADDNKGERRAFKEWLDENKNIKAEEYLPIEYIGKSFVLKQRITPL